MERVDSAAVLRAESEVSIGRLRATSGQVEHRLLAEGGALVVFRRSAHAELLQRGLVEGHTLLQMTDVEPDVIEHPRHPPGRYP
jgi:hypothetical protein